MAKIEKKYNDFISNKNFSFEKTVIDPILELIRDNQEYLIKPENLPQLAKLGYMYNTLWYSGRVCWGSGGKLRKGKVSEKDEGFGDCEDNPKYKIEMCDPISDEAENFIYDAWSLHVSDEMTNTNYDEFVKLIKTGKKLSDFEIKFRKPNKTFDEWVELLTDKRYKYSSLYPDRKSVANNLMCTIGTEYGFSKNGFVYKEAGGADQDEDMYGDWENAKFRSDIEAEVNKILSIPQIKMTLDFNFEYRNKLKEEKKKKENSSNKLLYDILKSKNLYRDEEGPISTREILDRLEEIDNSELKKKKKEQYRQYYPISSSSTIYKIGDKESQQREGIVSIDKSYMDISIEICKDILEHENEEEKSNVEFAKEFLGKMGFKEYLSHVVTIDKYDVLDNIRQYATDLTDNLGPEYEHNGFNYNDVHGNGWIIYLNDTRYNSYADNKYYFYARIDGSQYPKGYFNDVEDLKSTPLYHDIKSTISNILTIDEVKSISFYFDNVQSATIKMTISADKKAKKQSTLIDKSGLRKDGFMVGSTYIALEMDKLPFILRTNKPQKGSGFYYSVAKSLEVLDKSWKKIASFNIDENYTELNSSEHRLEKVERKFNSLHTSSPSTNSKIDKIVKWVMSQYDEMKKSDPGYGYGKKEGSKYLYAHDFMLWLKNNQDKYDTH